MMAVMGCLHHEELSYEMVRRDVNGCTAQFGDALHHFFRFKLGDPLRSKTLNRKGRKGRKENQASH